MTDSGFPLTERLRRARQLAGLDQRQLADALGIARNTVSNYETGTSEPSASNLVRWARATGASLDWLADGVSGGYRCDVLTDAPAWHRKAS